MHKLKAALLLCTIMILSVTTVLWSGGNLILFFLPQAEATAAPTESIPFASDSEEKPISSVSKTESVSSALSDTSVPVIENHTVSGEILTKTINPKSASLSYGNIYMKNTSGAAINIKSELAEEFLLRLTGSAEPEVLIYHTHATESFMLHDNPYYTTSDAARSTDKEKNMIAIGERLSQSLKAAGISVIHDTTLHDYPSYSGSYTASAKTINTYLKKYPSIKVIIDVHRDAIGGGGTDKTKLVKEIDGKTAAQVMIVMGSQTGVVSGYPKWKENLHLALRYQQTLENMYPGLARPMLLASKKYNQNLSTGAMLIEIGTDANTLSEALYSGELAGNALARVLNSLK